jgi:hypothetical protein
MTLSYVPYDELVRLRSATLPARSRSSKGRRIEQAYPLPNPCSDLDKFTA